MEKSQAVDYTSIDYLEGLEAEPQSVSCSFLNTDSNIETS